MLRRLSKDWEIFIFTASSPDYANKILNQIDPNREIFAIRLFRNECYQSGDQNIYIKDLRILDRHPSSVILVDDSPSSYGFQPENGVPIIPFRGDTEDSELLFLAEYLDFLKEQKDVRKVNQKHFKLHVFKEYKKVKEVIKHLF